MPQVPATHYAYSNYDDKYRWMSYWYHIQTIARTKASSALEIGCGNGFVSDYLRRHLGISVTTFDFDESLQPDIVGDVRNLSSFFQTRSFDTVYAFQVLEHLPFEDFHPVLTQMANVARSRVVISLPHWGYTLQLRLWVKRRIFVFGRKVTRPFTWKFDGQHYWEIGTRGYPLKRIVEVVSEVVDIESRYFCPDYPYHYFFECRVKP